MGTLIRKRMVSGVESENLVVDIHQKENRKSLQFVEIGTKTRIIVNEQTHLMEISQDKPYHFIKECLKLCLSAATYPLNRLPFYASILKDAQYLYPCKKKQVLCHQCH